MNTVENNLKRYGRVNTQWTDRFYSDRFLNPSNVVCPTPNKLDNMGREVNANSLKNKVGGCHPALDIVNVENQTRPSGLNSPYANPYGIMGQCDDEPEDDDIRKAYELYHRLLRKGVIVPDITPLISNIKRQKQWVNAGQKALYYKSMAGCL